MREHKVAFVEDIEDLEQWCKDVEKDGFVIQTLTMWDPENSTKMVAVFVRGQ